MGINYTDDISGQSLPKEESYSIQATKFYETDEGKKRMQKSKNFYVSLASITKTFGDGSLEWTVMEKTDNGWVEVQK